VADTLSREITVSYVTTDVLPTIVASWHQNPSLVYLIGKLLSGTLGRIITCTGKANW
jgi:hypothetical protein